MVEVISLFGALQLLLHRAIPGPLRERILIAHLRFQGGPQALGPLLQDVAVLVGSTRGGAAQVLGKLPLPPAAVGLLIGCLKSDDVYGQLAHYPSAQHRSTALSQQVQVQCTPCIDNDLATVEGRMACVVCVCVCMRGNKALTTGRHAVCVAVDAS